MIEVEVEEDPGSLPDDPVFVERHEEALGKDLGVLGDVRLRQQLLGLGGGERGRLEGGTCGHEIGRQVHVPDLAHARPPTTWCS